MIQRFVLGIFAVIFCHVNAPAQQTTGKLIPYQVQNYANWDVNKLWGYKDEQFNIVIQPVNEQMNLFENGYVVLKKNKRFGLMDAKGNVIIEPIYISCSNVENDYVAVADPVSFENYVINIKTKKTIKGGGIKTTQKVAVSGIPGIFLYSLNSSTGLLNENIRYGLSKENGESILPIIYKSIYKTEEGILKIVDANDKTGFINAGGKWVLEPKYNGIGRFNDGLAFVKINAKYGYINMSGKEIVTPQFDDANDFENGYAVVKTGAENFLIDTKGNTLFKGKGFKKANAVANNLFIIKNSNDSVYIIDKEGVALNKKAADYISTIDGSNFVMGIGPRAFYRSGDTVKGIGIKDIRSISKIGNSNYIINAKITEEKESHTITDKYLKPVINQDKVFSYSHDMKLSLIYRYIYLNNSYTTVLISYLNAVGKEYSDITR
ncbi:WG repeat-containing protein [Ferruginibacter profundus]